MSASFALLAELRGRCQVDRSAAALLEAAAELLGQVALLQRDGYLTDWDEIDSCCALGALSLVAKVKGMNPGRNPGVAMVRGSVFYDRRRTSQQGAVTESMQLHGRDRVRYSDAVRLLTEVTGYYDLQAWNDTEGRSRDEVLDAFVQAAELARSRGL